VILTGEEKRARVRQLELAGDRRRAGIVGWPVVHSLSPILHGHWLNEHHINGDVMLIPARPEEFAHIIKSAWALGLTGVNVTVPHKQAAFALAHRLDNAAENAGAVNLLVFNDDGTLDGRNTDSLGLAESLRENIGELNGKDAVLLGAGGAARGAILALNELGAGTIHLLNRDVGKARSLAADLKSHVKSGLRPGSIHDAVEESNAVALLVNSTSAGMTGHPPLDFDISFLPKSAAVCDIVYSPLETALLKNAAARGHKIIDGLGMLMHQAAPSFEAFFGVRPKVTPALRDALVKVLRARQN